MMKENRILQKLVSRIDALSFVVERLAEAGLSDEQRRDPRINDARNEIREGLSYALDRIDPRWRDL